MKIADFGIAKLVRLSESSRHTPCAVADGVADIEADGTRRVPATNLTAAGQIVGTPQYMAPEQIEHPLQVDHRADIYSLGVVFYQMLTGELPIGRFAPPSRKVQIDVRLDEVVLRALEKEPERRYQQASDLKTRVETIVTTPSPAVRNGFVLVARRDGERVVNWRGVVTVGLIMAGIILAGEIATALLLSGGWARDNVPYLMMSALALALLFLLGGMYRAFQTPFERLTTMPQHAGLEPVSHVKRTHADESAGEHEPSSSHASTNWLAWLARAATSISRGCGHLCPHDRCRKTCSHHSSRLRWCLVVYLDGGNGWLLLLFNPRWRNHWVNLVLRYDHFSSSMATNLTATPLLHCLGATTRHHP